MTDDPSTRDITSGFEHDVFADLTEVQRDAIVQLLARASEQGYRRGFQQGVSIHSRRPESIREDLYAWRYGSPTDDSPWADGSQKETASSRLFTENKHLDRLGLRILMWDAIVPDLRPDPTYVPRGTKGRR